jgi:hypothetical protein
MQLGARTRSVPCQAKIACTGDPGLRTIAVRVPFGVSSNVDSVVSPPITILPSSVVNAQSRSTVKDISSFETVIVPVTLEPSPVASSTTAAPMGGNRKVPDASSAGLGDDAVAGWAPVPPLPGTDWQPATATTSSAAAAAINFARALIELDLHSCCQTGAVAACPCRWGRPAPTRWASRPL